MRDTFCSYGVMELCVRELAPQVSHLANHVQLSCVRTCVVVAEERPRASLCHVFAKLMAPLGLRQRCVSTSFGCRVNVAICMQGASSPDPATVYVDARALRNDRVTLVEKGAPHSLALVESGKLLPGVNVVIANPDTRGQCADSHLGEIWVSSPHNAAGYFTVYGEETAAQVLIITVPFSYFVIKKIASRRTQMIRVWMVDVESRKRFAVEHQEVYEMF